MVVSAFPFLNELDLLEYRLEIMAPMVDLFVLMESPVTFSGLPKPLYYALNKARFSKWNIHHLVVEERPSDKLWEREEHQRARLLAEVERLAPDIAVFSDCDEIVRPDSVSRFIDCGHGMMRFELDMLTFYLNRKDSLPWIQGCIMKWVPGVMPEICRGCSPIMSKAGWHFVYMGGQKILLEKAAATSHGPEADGLSFRAGVAQGQLPGFERTTEYPISSLPVQMQRDIDALTRKGWIYA